MKWFKRLFCPHIWVKAKWNKLHPAWYESEWECIKCEKHIKTTLDEIPLSYIGD